MTTVLPSKVDLLRAGMDRAVRLGLTDEEIADCRRECDQLIASLESVRYRWWQHHRLLSRFIQPRLGRFIPVANTNNRGGPKNQHILNSTATLSSQRFGAGMMDGASSPARPWFRLRLGDGRRKESAQVRAWLDEVTNRIMHVFAESNFYEALAACYEELGVFGTAAMLIDEDYQDVIRCYPQSCGEYFLANDERLDTGVFARKFVRTVREIVGKWGLFNVSQSVRSLYESNQHDTGVILCHVIKTNDKQIAGAFGHKGMPWREVYWEYGSGRNEVLSVAGYPEKPFAAPRWNVTSDDAYGRSPGMDALGDIIQIQLQEKLKAQLIEKSGKPPMGADMRLKNEPASTIAGGVTYFPVGSDFIGFKPLFEIKPEAITAVVADIERCEKRVKTAFFEDLFLMISQMPGVQPKNEMEITELKEEKMLMLGPALTKVNRELLAQSVSRTFAIMSRVKFPGGGSMLPPAPDELRGQHVGCEFVSVLAQAQKAVATTSIERVWAFAGNIAAERPEVLDKLDSDASIDEYADLIGAPMKIVVPDDKVAAIRAARAKTQQQASAVQTGLAAAQGGKVLSETDVGGGVNALQRMTGGA